MKTQDEIFKICSVCKNRGFDPRRGILCSFTNDKPHFEEKCSNFSPDEKEITLLEKKAKEEAEERKNRDITGWLAVFLWLGIGGGVILSIIRTFLTGFYNNHLNLWVNLFSYLQILIIICTAISTIVTFYAKKGNAVAWAKTYIAMITLDGLACFLVYILSNTTNNLEFAESIRSFVWATIWFTFLVYSADVEYLIPKKTRFWGNLEKVLLLIYFILIVSYTIAISFLVTTGNDIVTSNKGKVEIVVEELSKETPMKLEDGVYLQKILIEDNKIIRYFSLDKILKSDYNNYILKSHGKTLKYQEVKSLINNSDPDTNDFLNICFAAGYDLIYIYLDYMNQVLYEFEISASDIEFAKNNTFICPKKDIIELIEIYDAILPTSYMGDATLTNISLSNDTTITYSINLPEMTSDELRQYIPFDYLKQYVYENWSALQDHIIQIAELNQMNISFDFNMYNGCDYVTIEFTPEEYNSIM